MGEILGSFLTGALSAVLLVGAIKFFFFVNDKMTRCQHHKRTKRTYTLQWNIIENREGRSAGQMGQKASWLFACRYAAPAGNGFFRGLVQGYVQQCG